MNEEIKTLYRDYPELPYVSPERDVEAFLQAVRLSSSKKVAKRQMIRTVEGYLPGHIILLWRVGFGTYTNQTPISKYFEYTYGIDAKKELESLIAAGLVEEMTAMASLKYLPAGQLKAFLKEKGVSGLSKMKRLDLDEAMAQAFTEKEVASLYELRGYHLTPKGEALLASHPEIVAKHPQKKF